MKLNATQLESIREGNTIEGAPAMTPAQIENCLEWAGVADGKLVSIEPALGGFVRMTSRMKGKSASPAFWFGPNGEELRQEPDEGPSV